MTVYKHFQLHKPHKLKINVYLNSTKRHSSVGLSLCSWLWICVCVISSQSAVAGCSFWSVTARWGLCPCGSYQARAEYSLLSVSLSANHSQIGYNSFMTPPVWLQPIMLSHRLTCMYRDTEAPTLNTTPSFKYDLLLNIFKEFPFEVFFEILLYPHGWITCS